MGCCTSSHQAPIASAVKASEVECDQRWDVAGFNAWCSDAQVAWAPVGYLRRLAEEGGILVRRQEVPSGILHIGPPPSDVQLFNCSYQRETREHPDPEGRTLRRFVGVLAKDGALDTDLAFFDYCSLFQLPRTGDEDALLAKQVGNVQHLFLFYRVRTVIVPSQCADGAECIATRGWTLQEFSMAAFAQRIVNQDDPLVRAHLTPEFLIDTERKIATGAPFTKPEDRDLVLNVRRIAGAAMTHARKDALGFQTVCRQANYCWVLVSFLHQLADRGGPAPRRQDLPPGSHIDGVVPAGRRPWVVSYGWAAVFHFSPSGAKVRELSLVLKELGAKPSDVVFLDYFSMWQAGYAVPELYASVNEHALTAGGADGRKIVQQDMAPAQKIEKGFALYETTRLYAFAGGVLPSGEDVLGCKVIVLPGLEDPHSFPDGGEIEREMNTFCQPPRAELNSRWGFAKSIPYESGGWTCAEYTIARQNGTIANAHHEDVRRVDGARAWPRDVRQFAEMMDEEGANPIFFTKKGDREAVRFNFYKFSYHFLDK
eukprot:CAMPEP_0171194482 /NCGR_PEP_ID=MMETSP0790-20130122/20912_1 /TAXON_ID=2925 /ORGANISM="Alexandrium catenella, Strain OF101" /LENGTH=540 /DNA_ID=CAMNT_0011659681 /DNA_START=25 /DNA_END=1647 /DNA_ORIENTATION=-